MKKLLLLNLLVLTMTSCGSSSGTGGNSGGGTPASDGTGGEDDILNQYRACTSGRATEAVEACTASLSSDQRASLASNIQAYHSYEPWGDFRLDLIGFRKRHPMTDSQSSCLKNFLCTEKKQ